MVFHCFSFHIYISDTPYHLIKNNRLKVASDLVQLKTLATSLLQINFIILSYFTTFLTTLLSIIVPNSLLFLSLPENEILKFHGVTILAFLVPT